MVTETPVQSEPVQEEEEEEEEIKIINGTGRITSSGIGGLLVDFLSYISRNYSYGTLLQVYGRARTG